MSAVEPPFLGDLRREFERVTEADAAAGRSAPRYRLQLPSLRLRVAVPVATAVAMLAALIMLTTGVVSLSIDVGGGDPVPMEAPTDPIVSGFDARLVERVSALGRERVADDAIDASIAGRLPAALAIGRSLRVVPPPGAELGNATEVGWLVPVGSDLAIVVWSPGLPNAQVATQMDLAGLERGRAIGSIGSSLFGVVPDGVDKVTITTSAGRARDLPVQDNVFVADLSDGFGAVSWEGMERP